MLESKSRSIQCLASLGQLSPREALTCIGTVRQLSSVARTSNVGTFPANGDAINPRRPSSAQTRNSPIWPARRFLRPVLNEPRKKEVDILIFRRQNNISAAQIQNFPVSLPIFSTSFLCLVTTCGQTWWASLSPQDRQQYSSRGPSSESAKILFASA